MKLFALEHCSSVIKGLSKLFEDRGVYFVDEINLSDVVISSDLKKLEEIQHPHKLFWTNEPRWSNCTNEKINAKNETIYVMNCFTNDVFVDIFAYLWVAKYKKIPYLTSEDYENKVRINQNRIAHIIASLHNYSPYVVNGEDLNLYKVRDDIAILGNSLNLVDIYGQNWQDGVRTLSIESRMSKQWSDWEVAKLEISKTYKYSICLENTNSTNYVTEKFWHAIMSQTIPIYYNGYSNIDKYFDLDNLIIVDRFEEFNEIFEYIQSLDKSQYMDKMNSLIEQANEYIENPIYLQQNRVKLANNVCNKIESIVNS